MNDLEHIYRDPLFGIATLVALIAFVILADYYRNLYRKKKKEESLIALMKSYEHSGFFDGIAEFLKVSKDPIPTLLFLAEGYVRSGDHSQAIKIYLTLIKQDQDSSQRLKILEGLGEAYLQTGFLQKTKEIYLEILKNNPRNTKTLQKMIKLYESLGDYQNALETLDCIEENLDSTNQDPKILLTRQYLQTQLLIQDHQKLHEQKNWELLDLLSQQEQLQKVILAYFKTYAPELFWSSLPTQNWENYIDLLWDFSIEQIPQDIIAQSPAIEVFQAKGYYPSKRCTLFALETIRLFNAHSSQKAQLGFAYQCKECLREFPFDSFRCPQCEELGIMKLILKPQKAKNEKSVSLL